jgi:hypothetical protein
MNPCFVRRRLAARSLVVLGALSLLAACEDKRVQELQTGITRDSVMSVVAQNTRGTDSMPSIYSREQYQINGKSLEVLYFDAKDRKQGPDTVALKNLTPILMYDGKMVGKGWPVWDSVAKANKIPVKPR